jgi:hypothetical protein
MHKGDSRTWSLSLKILGNDSQSYSLVRFFLVLFWV